MKSRTSPVLGQARAYPIGTALKVSFDALLLGIPVMFLTAVGEFGAGLIAAVAMGIVLIAGHFAQRVVAHSSLSEALAISGLDGLTGLPGRGMFLAELQEALAGSTADGEVAVFFLDLDNFKSVNDALGHLAGDHVLIEVASRLRDALDLLREAKCHKGQGFLLGRPMTANRVTELLVENPSIQLQGAA